MFIAFKRAEASSQDCPPERNATPDLHERWHLNVISINMKATKFGGRAGGQWRQRWSA